MTIKIFDRTDIIELWNAGKSPQAIKDQLKINLSTRQIKRIGASDGDWRKRWAGRMAKYEADIEAKHRT